ncbi:MAG: DEAD/DEAH box helicase [Chloroflexota bacterium]
MDPRRFLYHLRSLPAYRDQIVHVEHIPARQVRYAEPEKPLHPALQWALKRQGIDRLYSHQAQALDLARAGSNLVVSTGTASGKTLCYHLPVLEEVLQNPRAKALYLYPTKALAQDQLRNLRELTAQDLPFIKAGTYDRDTAQQERAQLRRTAQIILTNPDMLHLGILPNHSSWARFFANLRYVVVDEAHYYSGILGSQVANVLRRLNRILDFYRARPQYICCSATIANPQEHVERLTGKGCQVVSEDGSPRGPKDFVFWNPSLLDSKTGTRRSANSEATLLFTELVKQGVRNVIFAKTRKVAELILLYSREALSKTDPELTGKIRSYRAGYRAEERRQIERELFQGHLLGVASTTALELGVDIGGLDATVLTGYPGSVASAWQQAGRSGRGLEPSLSVLVGLDGPLDQYLMRHPQEFFGKPHEHALIDPNNENILRKHLPCAAYELPLSGADAAVWGDGETLGAVIQGLGQQGILRPSGERWFYAQDDYPAQEVNLRTATSREYDIVDVSRGRDLLGTVNAETAFFFVHPGAIYLHQGETYLVQELDLRTQTASVVPVDVNYYTQTKDLTDVRIVQALKERRLPRSTAYWGQVQVTTQIVGFKRKQQFTETVLSEEPLDLPPQTFDTRALWFDVPAEAMAGLAGRGQDPAGGLHALEHAAIAMLPLFALCGRNDIGGVSTLAHPDTGRAQVFIYDNFPGGVGISAKGFESLEALWEATLRTIRECPCDEGCPSCVQSPKCGNNNEPLDKEAAVAILQTLLGRG